MILKVACSLQQMKHTHMYLNLTILFFITFIFLDIDEILLLHSTHAFSHRSRKRQFNVACFYSYNPRRLLVNSLLLTFLHYNI